MKKEIKKTNRRTGSKGQHESMLQSESTTYYPDNKGCLDFGEIFAGSMKKLPNGKYSIFSDQWDADYLLKKEIELNQTFLKEKGLPFDNQENYHPQKNEDTRNFQCLGIFIKKNHDNIPGATTAASNLSELEIALKYLREKKYDQAIPHIIHAIRDSRELVIADMEDRYLAETKRQNNSTKPRTKLSDDWKQYANKLLSESRKQGLKNQKEKIAKQVADKFSRSPSYVRRYLQGK